MHILRSIAATDRRFAQTGRILFLLATALTIAGSALAGDAAVPQVTPTLRKRSVAVLRKVMDRQERWVKVHAAEYLSKRAIPRE